MVKINKHLRNTANIEYIVIYWIYITNNDLVWFDTSKSCLPSRRANVDGRDKKTENRKTEN